MKKERIRKTDCTIKELPHTRWEVFKDLLKYQKRGLVSLSLLMFVFLLPLVVDIILHYIAIIGLASMYTDPSNIEVVQGTFYLIRNMMLLAIPCIMVMYLGLGGLAEACKNLVWQEGSLVGPDFFKGIKKSFKTTLPMGFIMGLSSFLLIYVSLYLLRVSSIPSGIGVGAIICQFVILSIISMYVITQCVYYDNKFFQYLKNGFIFFVCKFGKNLLLFAATIGLIVGLIIIGLIPGFIALVLAAFTTALMMVGWTLLSHSTFDKYINRENYPEYLNKGLYKETPKEE